jgi:phosphoribosylformylglycinamidine cyclo-ligase
VLPEGLKAQVYKSKIKTLPVFDFMSQYVEESEMHRTFNMGVGMILVVSPENVDAVLAHSDGYVIGELVEGERSAVML